MRIVGLADINSRLFSLYKSNLANLRLIYEKAYNLGTDDYANPLLLLCHEGYVSAKKKLLFIGQETCSWFSELNNKVLSADDISKLQNEYLRFMLPQTYVSPFWLFIYEVNRALSQDSVNYMWSNIWKMGKRFDAGRADIRINELETAYFNVSKKEIEILNPDYVVFLSGPNYDKDIISHFGEFKIIARIDKCFEQFSIEGFDCQIFRMYHPNYLNYLGSKKRQEYQNNLIDLISR